MAAPALARLVLPSTEIGETIEGRGYSGKSPVSFWTRYVGNTH